MADASRSAIERERDVAGSILRAPLLCDCRSRAELRDEVRTTVVHEIAHFFGLDDDHDRRLGY